MPNKKGADPRFSLEHALNLSSDSAEFYLLNDRAIYVMGQIAPIVFWFTRWDKPLGWTVAESPALETLQWEIFNQMSTPVHFDELLPELVRIATATEALVAAVEGIPDNGISVDAIAGFLGLIDPRLAVLLQLVDSIDDVMGGAFEPPPET